MNLLAVVPVKPFAQAKSRLAEALSAAERSKISRYLLGRTLATLEHALVVEHTLVISPDPAAWAIAARHGASAMREEPPYDLNHAVHTALAHALTLNADAALILPADLPLLTPDDVRALVALAAGPKPAVALAFDRHGLGTNALLMRPPGVIPCAFGSASAARHQQAAEQAGVLVQVCHAPGWGLDVDTVDDLLVWRQYLSHELGHVPLN